MFVFSRFRIQARNATNEALCWQPEIATFDGGGRLGAFGLASFCGDKYVGDMLPSLIDLCCEVVMCQGKT